MVMKNVRKLMICSEKYIMFIGPGGGMKLRDGLDASGRKGKVGV